MSSDPQQTTFAEIAQANAEDYAENVAEGFDCTTEGASLRSLFTGKSSAILISTCTSQNQSTKLLEMREKWSNKLEAQTDESIGSEIKKVVVLRDAPHLRASSIEDRIVNKHVGAAVFGLITLVGAMAER